MILDPGCYIVIGDNNLPHKIIFDFKKASCNEEKLKFDSCNLAIKTVVKFRLSYYSLIRIILDTLIKNSLEPFHDFKNKQQKYMN